MGRASKPASLAEQLNIRFNSSTNNLDSCNPQLPLRAPTLNKQLVPSSKVAGLDRLRGRVLKECCTQVGGVVSAPASSLTSERSQPSFQSQSPAIEEEWDFKYADNMALVAHGTPKAVRRSKPGPDFC